MYVDPRDEKPKSLNEIMTYLHKVAGLENTQSRHEAVDDCMMVAKALWYGVNRGKF